MHVVFVDDRLDPGLTLRLEEELVGQRCSKRRDAPSSKVLERAVALAVRRSDGQNFAELVVRNGDREPGLPARRVFEAAEADVEIPSCGRGFEACKPDLDETRRATQLAREQRRNLDVEADYASGIARIGLDKGRPSLGIAAPAELRCRLRAGIRCKEKQE
jgi:hypothetical protein